jgi:nucleoside-diphosphate-sugar epimerase
VKILVLGANSRLGPYVVQSNQERHTLRLADVTEVASDHHETCTVDLGSPDDVLAAAEGMDAIVNCTVERRDPRRAFDVNTRGCFNMMRAAVDQGVKRVINTGPHFAVAGPSYETFDTAMNPDMPPHPGVGLYAHSKGAGQEICRIFSTQHEIQVLMLLFYNFRDHDDTEPGRNHPFAVSWRDAGDAVRLALEVDAACLDSRCEVFNIHAVPHGTFRKDKALRVLGFEPQDDLRLAWGK